MGSQQLLLLIVGVLMVGLMISVGIIMFGDNASASNRDAIANDLTAYASKAQVYQRRPRYLSGGGGSFQGFTLGKPSVTNLNGTYTISATAPASTTIEGVGIEIGFDRVNPVKVAVTVMVDSIAVAELN